MVWNDVVELLSGAGLAHLATADAAGRPHVSTVGVGVEGEALWFATRPTSGKARALASNSRVALMWQGNSAETYVWGDAAVFADAASKRRVWEAGILPYDPAGIFGAPDSPGFVVVRVTPSRATAMVAGPAGLERRTWRAGNV